MIIDGKNLASKIKAGIKEGVASLKKTGITPGLAVILVGDDPASQIYVKNKRKACDEAGISSFEYRFPEKTTQKEIEELVKKLNLDKKIHGILIQLPLPSHIKEDAVLEMIDPKKDVDGFHPVNLGKLLAGLPCLKPCTPLGVMALLDSIKYELKGKNAVVLGRSRIVGKPVAMLLLERHATVTICHSRTQNLPDIIKRADILVAAIGSPKFVKGDWIKKGAVVIDVGINRDPNGKMCGDVDFDTVSKYASAITPVPGGVGPMTIAMLLKNTVLSTSHFVNQYFVLST